MRHPRADNARQRRRRVDRRCAENRQRRNRIAAIVARRHEPQIIR